MTCGVKFCGGCNPRFQRGDAFQTIKDALGDRIDFRIAREGQENDILLVISGCTNNCASIEGYPYRLGSLKMWDESHIHKIIDELTSIYEEWKEEGATSGLEG